MKHGLLATCLLLLIAPVAVREATAELQPAPKLPVVLQTNRCEAVANAQVRAILRVELLGRVPDDEDASGGSAQRYAVEIRCGAEQFVVSVTPPTGSVRDAQLSLGTLSPEVRARIVALTVAELVRDLDNRLPPADSPPMRESSGPAQAPEQAHPPLWQTGAWIEGASFSLRAPWLVGGGARINYGRGWLGVGVDAAALTGSERLSFGNTQTLLAYAAPHVDWRVQSRRIHHELGLGVAVGAARVDGTPDVAGWQASSTTGMLVTPFLMDHLAVALARSFGVELTVRVGWTLGSVVGQEVVGQESDGRSVDLSGPWTSVGIGVDWEP